MLVVGALGLIQGLEFIGSDIKIAFWEALVSLGVGVGMMGFGCFRLIFENKEKVK